MYKYIKRPFNPYIKLVSLISNQQRQGIMNITIKTPVGDIVRKNFRTTSIFQEYHIDYCCGGNRSLEEATQSSSISLEELILKLNSVASLSDPDTEYINRMNLGELTDYIITRHHSYVKHNIPFITANLGKLCSVHGDNHSELLEMKRLFDESASQLTMHMQKEEIMLFPYIKRLIILGKEHAALPQPAFGTIANPIQMMIREHQNEGERFESISRISGNYSLPVDACATYEVTYKQLKDFEKDLHRHIHLENNIVFPQALKMEREWMT
jgi:regulator of cell morphogenesis and NO signaling